LEIGRIPSAHERLKFLYPEGGPGRQLKARLNNGQVLIGGILDEYARPLLPKLYQQAGFDFLYVEYEHVSFTPADLADTVLASRDNGLPVIAKTPQLERQEVAKLLEMGVTGIQLPRTESRSQIEELYSYMKFPPVGTRAVAPGYGNSDYIQPDDWSSWMIEQDEETTLVIHIETKLGYENAEEIVSTSGVDMVYLGPGDFSIEMGYPGDYDHPSVAQPMMEILELCKKHGVAFGTTATNAKKAGEWVSKGAQFFETDDERAFIIRGAKQLIEDYRRNIV
tara:strand:- start:408 stop:1247 length:840 start_codon:yes stop_codon:yes gene_type:complete